MKPFKICLIIAYIINILTSCNHEKKDMMNYKSEMKKIDTITISFPDSIPKLINASKKHLSNKRITFLTDSDDLTIYNYNIETKSWKKHCIGCINTYPIKYSGPYSILNDTVLVYFHSYNNEILFIDYIKNLVLKNIKLKEKVSFSSHDNIHINTNDSVIKFPIISNQYADEKYINTSQIGLEFDLIKNVVKKTYNYPRKTGLTHLHNFSLLIPDCVFEPDRTILSFPSIDKIFVYNDTIDKYYSLSNNGQNIIKDKEYIFNGQDGITNAILIELSGQYKDLIYDQLNNLFYRIFVTYPEFTGHIPKSKEQFEKIVSSRKLTVSVMNSNLQEIACNDQKGVTEFMCFTSNGKLYMLENDVENTDDLERFIGFELTEL